MARVAKTRAAVTENRIQVFVRETKSELRKVVWPSRQEATNLTMIVTGVSIAVGLFLGGVDLFFKKLFEIILGGF
ncbi:MAG: preprotein translocase subunit SecE [Chloroflexi bacterium]|nr:preprotein translocase subunit SecE [Chloroflexota bacterium]